MLDPTFSATVWIHSYKPTFTLTKTDLEHDTTCSGNVKQNAHLFESYTANDEFIGSFVCESIAHYVAEKYTNDYQDPQHIYASLLTMFMNQTRK